MTTARTRFVCTTAPSPTPRRTAMWCEILARSSSVFERQTPMHPLIEAIEKRLLMDAGDLDVTFAPGDPALQVLDVKGGNDTVAAIATYPDGRILVGGRHHVTSTSDSLLLARYNADGSLDKSFGGSGIIVNNPRGATDVATISVLADGSFIVLARSARATSALGGDTLMHFSSTGRVDTNFGKN